MVLFYFRFLLDGIISILIAAFLSCGISYSMFPEQFSQTQNLIFYLSLPASNFSAIRSIVALFISVERVVAAYFPIQYHNYHQSFPKIPIMITAIIYGFNEDIVLYVFCDFQLNIPKNCTALGCAINECFYQYWTTHKSIVFALIFLSSLALCFQLFMLNKREKKGKNELTKLNRLALIDGVRVLLADFLPNLVANQLSRGGFSIFQSLGPYEVVAKKFGCATEAILVLYTLRHRTHRVNDISDSKLASGKSNFIFVK
ncbi:Serpentine Receptor, class BC (Class B-like) [Caenorhabditis elegans]|nr:Serpentine Receptor, class BC (Class B-like) [Caenorhabditis elegans]CTQ86845.1 Serpentine Receptor, class BC (Class B-like) [Caenorhabditis elegans]|eukprot:NP_001300146.1 Serpentine Receptor, class BC (class B-like) [Caenorhabditis elegans]